MGDRSSSKREKITSAFTRARTIDNRRHRRLLAHYEYLLRMIDRFVIARRGSTRSLALHVHRTRQLSDYRASISH